MTDHDYRECLMPGCELPYTDTRMVHGEFYFDSRAFDAEKICVGPSVIRDPEADPDAADPGKTGAAMIVLHTEEDIATLRAKRLDVPGREKITTADGTFDPVDHEFDDREKALKTVQSIVKEYGTIQRGELRSVARKRGVTAPDSIVAIEHLLAEGALREPDDAILEAAKGVGPLA